MSETTFTGLNRQFDIIVNTMAARLFPTGFDVDARAPATLDALTEHVENTGRMLVWSGGSDRSIYGDDSVNHAFRAWHDFHHWKEQLPFTPEGEEHVCNLQIADIQKIYGPEIAEEMAPILRAEIMGQLQYAEQFGEFPTDQRGFVEYYLEHGTLPAARIFG